MLTPEVVVLVVLGSRGKSQKWVLAFAPHNFALVMVSVAAQLQSYFLIGFFSWEDPLFRRCAHSTETEVHVEPV